AFGKVLGYVQTHSKKCQMKEYKTRLILRIDEVLTIHDAIEILKDMS
ncbi:MAG: transcription-repair coupling factor (superfamily II helicase), partial [Roseivirga sp.]